MRLQVAKDLADQEAKLADVQNRKATVNEALTSSAEDSSSIGTEAGRYSGYLSPAQLIADLRSKLTDWKKFLGLLATLRNNGLGEKAYTQLVQLGVDEGLPIAQQLAAGSKDQLAEINSLQDQIASEATTTGTESSATYFDQGIATAQGLIDGLKKRQHELTKAAKTMAEEFVKEVRKALDIIRKSGEKKSGKKGKDDDDTPGKKGGGKKGGSGGDGGNGFGSTAKPRFMSGDTSSATQKLKRSGRRARRDDATQLGDGSHALARDINITGVDSPATAAAALNQTMWQIKRIRAGGRHSGKRALL